MLQATVTLQANGVCQRLVPHLFAIILSPIPILYDLTYKVDVYSVYSPVCALTIHVFHKQIYLSGQ